MKTYEIKTITTMKPYNNKNWWIDRDYIKPVIVKANNPKEALRAYCINVMDNNYIEISKTATNTNIYIISIRSKRPSTQKAKLKRAETGQ